MASIWRRWRTAVVAAGVLLARGGAGEHISLDLEDHNSTRSVAKTLAASTMAFYDGDKPGGTPGMLTAVGEFNWWEAGAMFGQMVEYWYYTGDDTWNNVTTEALLFQAGPEANYEPENQTRTEGNDDQAFWAFAAMSAAEMEFPNPPADKPQWLALAQAVFNRQAARWDDRHCGGGLRWQFNPLNNGWMLKNTISNGCFFQLAARLARYTKNETYAEWANKTYHWLAYESPLISNHYEVFDSIGFTEEKCEKEPMRVQWSYNIGTMIAGAAFMFNHTNGSPIWKLRLKGLLDHCEELFFPKKKIMVEYACESLNTCNKDQRSFKAYLARWLAVSTQLAPHTKAQIMPLLHFSAEAASHVCTITPDGIGCGRKWDTKKDDGLRDIGQQMTAMSIVQSNLIDSAPPLRDAESGSSKGDPGAGGADSNFVGYPESRRTISTADRAGAWFLTVLLLIGSITGAATLVADGDIKQYTGFLAKKNSWPGRSSWGSSSAA